MILQVHPWKLGNMDFFQSIIFRFYVNLGGAWLLVGRVHSIIMVYHNPYQLGCFCATFKSDQECIEPGTLGCIADFLLLLGF